MRRGVIYKNICANRETYFLDMGFPIHSNKSEQRATGGYVVTKVNGEWVIRRADYFINSLRDRKYFPVVGTVDVDQLLLGEALQTILKV